MQALRVTRPGGHMGYVGVAHGVELPGRELFFSHAHLHGGPPGAALPSRTGRPHLEPQIEPGKVFDLSLPLDQVAEATGRWTRARHQGVALP